MYLRCTCEEIGQLNQSLQVKCLLKPTSKNVRTDNGNTTTYLYHDSRSPRRDLNLEPPENEDRELITGLRRSVDYHHVTLVHQRRISTKIFFLRPKVQTGQ